MAESKQTKGWEIRRALLGHTVPQEDGTLAVVQPGQQRIFQGVRNGWGAVRLFGVGRTRRLYAGTSEEAMEQAKEAFRHVGRAIALNNLPEGKACLCRVPGGAPVLLTAELGERGLEIDAYAGRSPIAPLRRLWLLRGVERQLPPSLTRIEAEPEPKPVEEKEEKPEKQGKQGKREKQEKKKPEAGKRIREKTKKSKKK